MKYRRDPNVGPRPQTNASSELWRGTFGAGGGVLGCDPTVPTSMAGKAGAGSDEANNCSRASGSSKGAALNEMMAISLIYSRLKVHAGNV